MAKEITMKEFKKHQNAEDFTTSPADHKPVIRPDGSQDLNVSNVDDYYLGRDQIFIVLQ